MPAMKQVNIQLPQDEHDADRTPYSMAKDPLIRDLVDDSLSPRRTELYYFKYVPYERMTAPEKKRYLGSMPNGQRDIGSASDHQPTGKALTKWSTAQVHGPRHAAFHLAEMSLYYRAPPELSRTVKLQPVMRTSPEEDAEQQNLQEMVTRENGVAKEPSVNGTTNSSSRCTSRRSSRASRRQSNRPEEILANSTSNRLLNVISIDECHVNHRRARRAVRSQYSATGSRITSRQEKLQQEKEVAEDEVEFTRALVERMSVMEAEQETRERERTQSNTARSGITTAMSRRQRDDRAMQRAARLHEKRNQLLREQMDIYLQWRLAEKAKERESLARGGRASSQSIRQISKAERLKTFSNILREKETEFAQTMDSARNSWGPQVMEEHKLAASDMDDSHTSSHSRMLSPENKLTEMFQMLQ